MKKLTTPAQIRGAKLRLLSLLRGPRTGPKGTFSRHVRRAIAKLTHVLRHVPAYRPRTEVTLSANKETT